MENDNSRKKLTLTAILLCGMTLLTIATLFIPNMIEGSVNKEIDYLESLLGENDASVMHESASNMTNDFLYENGLIENVRGLLLPKSYLEGTESAYGKTTIIDSLWQPLDQAIQAIALNVNLFLLRVLMFKVWLYALVVLLIASFLTGYLQREIKKHGFEYSSPMRHGLSRRMIYVMPVITFIYLIAPFAIPPVIVPFIMMIFCFAVMTLIANTIKRV